MIVQAVMNHDLQQSLHQGAMQQGLGLRPDVVRPDAQAIPPRGNNADIASTQGKGGSRDTQDMVPVLPSGSVLLLVPFTSALKLSSLNDACTFGFGQTGIAIFHYT